MGLEDRIARRLPVDRIASVASVFTNQIDTAVDRDLDTVQQPAKAVHATRLRTRAAVAVAQLVYQRYKSVVASPRWLLLARYHAQTQRLLWAGTEMHDSGVKYVNELIGRDTAILMSLNTLDAFLDHGIAAPTLERNLADVLPICGELDALGIDLDRISTQLESESLGAIAAGVNSALTRLASAA